MSEEKQKKAYIKLKEYDKAKEELLQLALEKYEKGEELSEEEIEILEDYLPTEEKLQKLKEQMQGLEKTLKKVTEPQIDIVNTISQSIDKITQPFTNQISHFAKSLSKSLQPVFEELDSQYKENPLTKKEIDEGSKFFDEYIKEKEKLIKEIESLNNKQEKLYSNIFEKTKAPEEDIVKYKLESEEIDFPSNIFNDISKKIEGKPTTKETLEKYFEKYSQSKFSKNFREKIKTFKELENQKLEDYFTEKELKDIEKGFNTLQEETLIFDRRPSRLELEHLETERPFKYILYKSTDIPFENITENDFKEYLQEEIDILKKAIKIRKTISSYNNEILNIFSRASNPYFEGKKEEELSEKDKKLKEDFYNTSFIIFQNSSGLEKLFSNIFLKRREFKEMDIERQERFFEFLRYSLDDLEDLQKKWDSKKGELVDQYLSTNLKNKLLTTEKIVPQLFLKGEEIEKLFKNKESGKIEKVTFDLSSGDSNKNFIIHFLMKEYPLTFTEDTFKTLESLMTIQNQMEKQFGTLQGIVFDTKYVIYLNRGGRVTNYSKDLIKKTNREIVSLMSAIGSMDTTDFFYKYYNLDEKTIVDENEAIFQSMTSEKEWNKKVDEIRKEKMKKMPEDKKFPIDKIKKISTIQPFVSLKGLNIESEEESYNNTLWKFNDIDEKPIPLFEILKMTGRFSQLPLEMDSYLTDSTMNNEVTRNLKTIVANLNYFKSNKEMKKDKTKRNFLDWYYLGTREGSTKEEEIEPSEAISLIRQKKFFGSPRYRATRTIDSIAKDCKLDNERGIGVPKKWKHNKEKLRFIDSIIEYLRKAKEDKNIDNFILYTTKNKIVKNEKYITENEKRSQKTKDKLKGKPTKTRQTKNPTIEKISIIIK